MIASARFGDLMPRLRANALDVTGIGSIFHSHFTKEKVRSVREARDADQESCYANCVSVCLPQGICWSPKVQARD